jgi:hypothetical protein
MGATESTPVQEASLPADGTARRTMKISHDVQVIPHAYVFSPRECQEGVGRVAGALQSVEPAPGRVSQGAQSGGPCAAAQSRTANAWGLQFT